MTKYLILLAYEPSVWNGLTPEQQAPIINAHKRFHAVVGEQILASEPLADREDATTMRHLDGRMVLTEGPFAETVEMIGGFYLVQAEDLDQVIDWCRLLPQQYSVEIRPCVVMD